jgi:hypothetical protein
MGLQRGSHGLAHHTRRTPRVGFPSEQHALVSITHVRHPPGAAFRARGPAPSDVAREVEPCALWAA